MGKALITGFSQVARDSEVKKYLLRGVDICAKHIKIFSSLLSDENIPVPQSPDTMVTNSITAPFSDSFMLNHIVTANTLSIADMGLIIAQSNRADIAADTSRLTVEIMQYGEDGLNILIKNGWMEAPPQVVDHHRLALSGKTGRQSI